MALNTCLRMSEGFMMMSVCWKWTLDLGLSVKSAAQKAKQQCVQLVGSFVAMIYNIWFKYVQTLLKWRPQPNLHSHHLIIRLQIAVFPEFLPRYDLLHLWAAEKAKIGDSVTITGKFLIPDPGFKDSLS